MRRRIAALLAAFGMVAVLATVAAPSAYADRTTGPATQRCNPVAWEDLYTTQETIWKTGGIRDVYFKGVEYHDGYPFGYSRVSIWVTDSTGAWVLWWRDWTSNRNTDWYLISGYPPGNTAVGHQWKVSIQYYDSISDVYRLCETVPQVN